MSNVFRPVAACALLLGASMALSGCWLMGGGDHGLPGTAAADGTRSYAASGFDTVELAGSDNVVIRHGTGFSVIASGPAADLDQLVIRVRGDHLEVGRRNGIGAWGTATVTVTLPVLSGVTVAGSGDMTVDRLDGARSAVTIAGSGSARIAAVATPKLDINVAGSGALEASGRAEQIDANIAGSGSIDAPALTSGKADITVAGSGDVAMAVAGPATVTMMGSGDVTLTGGARCTTHSLGSGAVSCR